MCESVCAALSPSQCAFQSAFSAQYVRNAHIPCPYMSTTPSMADQAFCRQL